MTSERHDEEYVAALLRSLEDDDLDLVAPPESVWAGILDELGDEAPGAPTSAAPVPPTPVPTVTPLASRRRPSRPTGWLLAAAAAVVLLALVVVVGRAALTGAGRGTELASATLTSEGLKNTNDLVGRAELVRVGDRQEIDLDLPGLPGTDTAYYELWLLAPDGTRLQSLGITDGHGRYVVPTGVDPRLYPVVDVSREPPDGNPAHSGDSLVRGKLTI